MAKKASNLSKYLAQKKAGQPTGQPVRNTIGPRPKSVEWPLSYGQKRLKLLHELYPDLPLYNYLHRYRFGGTFELKQLIESLQVVVKKHQLGIRPELAGELLVIERPPVSTEELPNVYQEVGQYLFDLDNDPLLRLYVQPLADEQGVELLLLIHHIIGDRESLQLLQNEWSAHYRANEKETVVAEEKPLLYPDFAYWQSQQVTKESDIYYWKQQLAKPLPVLELPILQNGSNSLRGNAVSHTLSPQLTTPLKALASRLKTTPFVIGLAAFKALLYRYSGQADLLVGVPFSNRQKKELDGIIGFFNETLVLRSKLKTKLTFEALIQQLKQTTLDAFAHQNVPFDEVVKAVQPERSGTGNPLFQAMFVYNEAGTPLDFGPAAQVTDATVDLPVSKFDLTLFLGLTPEGLVAKLEFATPSCSTSAAEQLLVHFEQLLRQALFAPETKLTNLHLLSKEQQTASIQLGQGTTPPAPTANSVLDYFLQHVEEKPTAPAVRFQNDTLSYEALYERAQEVADSLKAANAIPATIGLMVSPSTDLLAGILGILLAGGAYLPLDPEYPNERLNFMLGDAGVSTVVVESTLLNRLEKLTTQNDAAQPKLRVIALDKNSSLVADQEGDSYARARRNHPSLHAHACAREDHAYTIYTSGSTGQPKGVPISHGNLLYSTAARFHFFQEGPGAFLLLSSYSFDSSVAGIFWTISSGGTLVLTPRRSEQDIQQLAQLVADYDITHTLMLPSLYGLLLDFAEAKQVSSLKHVMVAGEACPPNLVEQHRQQMSHARLYNEYGPTEGTVWCTAHDTTTTLTNEKVPIGRPIPYYQNYILDHHQQLVPQGWAGELYIGGPGLSEGYHQRPELTIERFIQHPQLGRLYRTGDRVSQRPDGIIDFLGRIDHQVKIRGHRVELGEIERQLVDIPPVQKAVVLYQAEQQILQAYLLTNESLDQQAIRTWLSSRLPAYMVPARLVQVREFPRLPNGKIDHKALSELGPITTSNEAPEPENELEEQLLDIWRKVLKDDQLTVVDNFFAVGGDSLRSISVIAKALQADIPLSPNHLFEYQSVRELATFLASSDGKNDQWQSLASLQTKGSKTPLFCIHSGAAHVFFYQSLAKHLGEDQPLYALQPHGLDGNSKPPQSIEEMARNYVEDIRQVQPNGPYALLGTCFSNAVGLEMAHQLRAAGEEVSHLLFIDSGPAHLLSRSARGGTKTLTRFGQMLSQADWQGIAKKIRNRLIRTQRKVSTPFKNDQAQHLQNTIDNLNELYANYNWEPYAGEIHFIRSSEFAERTDKDYHVTQWEKLSENQLHVQVVDGHHVTLFEEPEVKGLAKAVASVLEKR